MSIVCTITYVLALWSFTLSIILYFRTSQLTKEMEDLKSDVRSIEHYLSRGVNK